MTAKEFARKVFAGQWPILSVGVFFVVAFALVVGVSYAVITWLSANFISVELTNMIAGLGSLALGTALAPGRQAWARPEPALRNLEGTSRTTDDVIDRQSHIGEGDLPVAEGLEVVFRPQATDIHFTNHKPAFLLDLWRGPAASAGRDSYRAGGILRPGP